MAIRFEDRVYIEQWKKFRKPTLKDMTHNEKTGMFDIDCGICTLSYIIINALSPK